MGDIDREGARIVEQARNANVVEIRLHAGMYRAMLAEHKRRVKAGGECEPAAANQGVPQNLAATIKDLPMVPQRAARGRAHSAGDSDDRRLSGWRLGKLRPHAQQLGRSAPGERGHRLRVPALQSCSRRRPH